MQFKWPVLKRLLALLGKQTFLLCCLSVCLYSCANRCNFKAFRLKISPQDKQIVEPFLRDLFLNKDFGYALVGAKPVSIASYFYEIPFYGLLFARKLQTFDVGYSWSIFEKYIPADKSSNFLLFKIMSSFSFEGEEKKIHEFIIINKKMFLITVEEHLDLFREILGQWVTPMKLLDRIIKDRIHLFEILNAD